MGGIDRLEHVVADLESTIETAREVIRSGHELLKDLKAERRKVEELIAAEPERLVEVAINEAIVTGLNGYTEALSRAIDNSEAAIYDRFDRLGVLLLNGPDHTEPTLEDLVRARLEIDRISTDDVDEAKDHMRRLRKT